MYSLSGCFRWIWLCWWRAFVTLRHSWHYRCIFVRHSEPILANVRAKRLFFYQANKSYLSNSNSIFMDAKRNSCFFSVVVIHNVVSNMHTMVLVCLRFIWFSYYLKNLVSFLLLLLLFLFVVRIVPSESQFIGEHSVCCAFGAIRSGRDNSMQAKEAALTARL